MADDTMPNDDPMPDDDSISADDEAVVRAALRDAASDVAARPALDAAVARRRAAVAADRRRRVLAVAAVLLVAVGAAAVLVVTRDADPPDRVQTPATQGTDDPTSTTTEAPPVDADAWRRIAAAPVAPATDTPPGVWTGEEVLVWGVGSTPGTNQGLAYDPAADAWRELPPAPVWTFGASTVWTGTEMIVGPGSPDATPEGLGAPVYGAYDPATDAWRVVADPGAISGSPAAAVGGRVVLVGVDDTSSEIALLDPATGATTPPLSVPTGSQTASRPYGGVSVEALDDGRLAVVSTQNAAGRGTLSISTPEVDGWETTVEVPAGTRANGDGGLVEPRVVVAGDAVIVLGGTAVAYDVATGAWRDLAGMPGALVDDSTMPATWTGAEVLVGGFAYDPAVDEWWALAEPPMPLTSRPVATWAGTELVLWGGSFTCTRDEATRMCVESDEELYPADGLALRPD